MTIKTRTSVLNLQLLIKEIISKYTSKIKPLQNNNWKNTPNILQHDNILLQYRNKK
jgi:hypothetical protein